MGAEALAAALEHRALPRSETCAPEPLLWPDLAVGAVHFVPGFAAGGALAREVAFEDDGAVEEVAAER